MDYFSHNKARSIIETFPVLGCDNVEQVKSCIISPAIVNALFSKVFIAAPFVFEGEIESNGNILKSIRTRTMSPLKLETQDTTDVELLLSGTCLDIRDIIFFGEVTVMTYINHSNGHIDKWISRALATKLPYKSTPFTFIAACGLNDTAFKSIRVLASEEVEEPKGLSKGQKDLLSRTFNRLINQS
jgi:hypothetical protein